MEPNVSPEKTVNAISRFRKGVSYPFGALRIFREHTALLKYAFIPFLINTIVYVLFIFLTIHYFSDILHVFISRPDVWYMWILYYLVAILMVIVLFLLVFFSFTVVGSLIAGPFNDILSEKVEEMAKGKVEERPFSFKEMLGDLKRDLPEEGKKVGFLVSVQAGLLLLNLLPVLGSILYFFVAGSITLIFLAWEFVDCSLGRRKLRFAEKRRFVFGNKGYCPDSPRNITHSRNAVNYKEIIHLLAGESRIPT